MSDSLSSHDPDLVRLADDLRDPAKREQAAADLFRLLHEFLVSRIADRIAEPLQGKLSAESVVQEMWASFLQRREAGQFSFDDSQDVRGLMFTIAYNKLVDRIRKLTAKKRSPHLDRDDGPDQNASSCPGDSALLGAQPGERNNVQGHVFAGGRPIAVPEKLKRPYPKASGDVPAPAPIAEMVELASGPSNDWLDEFLAGADPLSAEIVKERIAPLDEDLKAVLRLRLQGNSLEDIAQETHRTLKHVRLKLEAIQEAFQDLYDDSQFGIDAPRHRPRAAP